MCEISVYFFLAGSILYSLTPIALVYFITRQCIKACQAYHNHDKNKTIGVVISTIIWCVLLAFTIDKNHIIQTIKSLWLS